MKRLVQITWMMIVVTFVTGAPHAVGATFLIPESNLSVSCATGWIPIDAAKKIAKEIGKREALKEWNSLKEWDALYELWMRESKWDYTADNKYSTAYGIPQILDMPKNLEIDQQIARGIEYIKYRYDKPSVALQHHYKRGWY